MLATTIHKSNTTPHHQSEATTSPIPGFPHSGRRDSGLVVSKPNSVSGSPSPASITRNPYRLNVCRAPEPHPLQVRPIQRIAQGHRTPTAVGGPQVSWCSLERRWSSRTFRYGYLVTTSSQSPIPPSTAPSHKGLGHRLRVLPTFM